MKTIRIINLYRYYLETLKKAVDTCYFIKAEYTNGHKSYNRAYKEMNQALKYAWQRYNLCFRLAEMIDCEHVGTENMALQEANLDLKFLTQWTIA